MTNRWQRTGLATASISAAKAGMRQIKATIERLLFLSSWIRSYGELAFLYAEDLSVFIRRRHRFQPKRYRWIDEICRSDSNLWFGVNPHDLRRIYRAWRIPETFMDDSRHTYTGEECFLIFLYHLTKGTPFTEMARHIFGGDPRRFSPMFEAVVNHLYLTFYNKISGTSLEQWIPRYIDQCRELIYNALSAGVIAETHYVDGEVVDETWILHHFDFASFRIFGFLDDFAMPTARPGNRASRLFNFVHDIQRAFYSGYLRRHGLKAQVVYLPIGIIASVYITELRQNDNGVQNMSGLNNYIYRLVRGGIFYGGLLPCLFGDGIFRILATIVPRFSNPTPALHLLNILLASQRECIEHVFGENHTRFKLLQVPDFRNLYNNGVKVRRLSMVSFFILNCYYCVGGSRCRYFGHIPPTLEDYVPLNEVLRAPPAVELGDVWEYGP